MLTTRKLSFMSDRLDKINDVLASLYEIRDALYEKTPQLRNHKFKHSLFAVGTGAVSAGTCVQSFKTESLMAKCIMLGIGAAGVILSVLMLNGWSLQLAPKHRRLLRKIAKMFEYEMPNSYVAFDSIIKALEHRRNFIQGIQCKEFKQRVGQLCRSPALGFLILVNRENDKSNSVRYQP